MRNHKNLSTVILVSEFLSDELVSLFNIIYDRKLYNILYVCITSISRLLFLPSSLPSSLPHLSYLSLPNQLLKTLSLNVCGYLVSLMFSSGLAAYTHLYFCIYRSNFIVIFKKLTSILSPYWILCFILPYFT